MLQKSLLKISDNCQENTSTGVCSWIRIAGLQLSLLKRTFWHRCFSENAKVSEYPFKQNRSSVKNMTVLLYFSYFMSSCTKRIAVSSNVFSLICTQPSDKQNHAHNFFIFKYVLDNPLSTVFMQNALLKLVELLQKRMNNSLLEKRQAQFCAAVC